MHVDGCCVLISRSISSGSSDRREDSCDSQVSLTAVYAADFLTKIVSYVVEDFVRFVSQPSLCAGLKILVKQ